MPGSRSPSSAPSPWTWPYGNVGQVVPVQANIRDEASTRRAMEGSDAVINCVGTFDKDGRLIADRVDVRKRQ